MVNDDPHFKNTTQIFCTCKKKMFPSSFPSFFFFLLESCCVTQLTWNFFQSSYKCDLPYMASYLYFYELSTEDHVQIHSKGLSSFSDPVFCKRRRKAHSQVSGSFSSEQRPADQLLRPRPEPLRQLLFSLSLSTPKTWVPALSLQSSGQSVLNAVTEEKARRLRG